jgi:HEAT repeat protein
VPVLIALASHPDDSVRRKSVEVLGELGGDDAAAALVTALEDEDSLVRGLAVWALAKSGSRNAATYAAGRLDDPGWSVAVNAAGALARLADPASGAAVCSALGARPTDSHLEANLLLAAAATGAPCAQSGAIAAYRRARQPVVRGAAARALGRLLGGAVSADDRAAATALLGTCRTEDESPEVQETCRAVLAAADAADAAGAAPDAPGAATDWIEFYLYSSDGRRLRPRGRFLLVLADGVVRAGATDINGFAREAPAPRGRYLVHDPAAGRPAGP